MLCQNGAVRLSAFYKGFAYRPNWVGARKRTIRVRFIHYPFLLLPCLIVHRHLPEKLQGAIFFAAPDAEVLARAYSGIVAILQNGNVSHPHQPQLPRRSHQPGREQAVVEEVSPNYPGSSSCTSGRCRRGRHRCGLGGSRLGGGVGRSRGGTAGGGSGRISW